VVQRSYRVRLPDLACLLHRLHLVRLTGLCRAAYHCYRRDFDPHQRRRVEMLMGAALLVRQDVFWRCGPWDEEFTFGGEDLHLSARVGRCFPLVFLPDVEIVHLGGVSTRQNSGFASSASAAGHACFLRKVGCPWPGRLVYKVLVTLDVPVQIVVRGSQYLVRRLRGQRAGAEKARRALGAVWYFASRGLLAFWRA
jgi:hypothetical protein